MKQKSALGVILAFGVIAGALVSPLNAQQQSAAAVESTCSVGEASNAACSGKWILFAGNTSGVDSGSWVVRMNGETGEVWYKNGKKFVLLEEPD
jgi:hypothetical protein